MPISSVHPSYQKQVNDWETMRDSLEGDQAIRASIQKYLPPPPGMNLRGSGDINDILGMSAKGVQSRYSHYQSFAEWPEIVSMTLNAIQGLIHEKPPTIELTADLEYLEDTATPAGDTLIELWETMTRETLSAGRIGLLSEIFEDETYICPYMAESITNWHVLPKILGGGAVLVVLKEVKSMPKVDDVYEHEKVTTYRELNLQSDKDELTGEELLTSTYRVRIWKAVEGKDPMIVINDSTDEDGWIIPEFFGKKWEEIPLTISNTNDRTYKYGALPLIAAARRAISIFRKTADYFRSLYNKGDPQAYIFGVDKEDAPKSIGGSSIWVFPEADGSAGYMDIDGEGIPLQRQAIDDQYTRFKEETGQLLNAGDAEGVKSGEALKREAASQQVTIKSIVINAAAAMQAHLRLMAKLMGKSDAEQESIIFTANLDFAEPLMSGKNFQDYVLAKTAGGPLSQETLHAIARRHKITDKTFEEETAEIEAEGPTEADIQRELDQEVKLAAAQNNGDDDEDGDGDDDENKDSQDENGDKPPVKKPKAKPADKEK